MIKKRILIGFAFTLSFSLLGTLRVPFMSPPYLSGTRLTITLPTSPV